MYEDASTKVRMNERESRELDATQSFVGSVIGRFTRDVVVVVAGMRGAGRGRKTWYECVKKDMKKLGLHAEWAVFRDKWRGFISGGTSNPSLERWTF
jgi:hypothetical protein